MMLAPSHRMRANSTNSSRKAVSASLERASPDRAHAVSIPGL